MMPTWVRGAETAAVVAPYPQKLIVTALGNSGSTGEKGITAEVAYFDSLDALKAVPDGSLDGKIAFVTHKMLRAQDGSGYSAFGPIRWFGPSIASQTGAVAYVIKSIGTDYHRNPHTGSTGFGEGIKPIPAGALSLPDADNLARMVKLARKDGKPVTMNLVLTPKNIGQQESGNVIAEVVGREPDLPMILVACHLDSWDLATGAFDDAAGCGIITAAAMVTSARPSSPNRRLPIDRPIIVFQRTLDWMTEPTAGPGILGRKRDSHPMPPRANCARISAAASPQGASSNGALAKVRRMSAGKSTT